MKRTALLLLLTIFLALPLGIAAPGPTYAAMPTIAADDCDHLAPMAAGYIGNARSYIFHFSGCRYVAQMNPGNKVYFDSRDEAIESGYRPCKVCRP